ncbi:MAG: hypothetical protein P8R39_11925 [Alphaproteobacteria bacterium]|nr:hypothetical protein [Alphaproteobacteria bacterium]
MHLTRALLRSSRFLLACLLALTLSACGESNDDDAGCGRSFDPVCAYVQPAYCGLGPGQCGNFRQTFDNACWARKAGATDLQRGVCKPTGQGAVPDPKDGPYAAPQLGFQSPVPPAGYWPAGNPYGEARLGEMFARQEDGLKITGARVDTRAAWNGEPEMILLVSGTQVSGCKQVVLSQSARIDDTFGIAVRSLDLRELGQSCGPVTAFTKSLKLDPGPEAFVVGARYEIVVNGRMGQFTVRQPDGR